MYELKTKPTKKAVEAVISAVPNIKKQEDAWKLIEIFSAATGELPVVWGEKAIGFGSYIYHYPTGQSGEIYRAGFMIGKDKFSLHVNAYLEEASLQDLSARLGKFKAGKSCIYINKLADINIDVLSEMITKSYHDIP